MSLNVFVFLLVVCLFFFLALLWRLDRFPFRPSPSAVASRCSPVHRLLKPRCPDGCPTCRLGSTLSSGGGPVSTPTRPWREVKSRRGARHPHRHRGVRLSHQASLVLRDHR